MSISRTPASSACQACFRRPIALQRDVLLAEAQEAQEASATFVPEPHDWVTFALCLVCARRLDRERAEARKRRLPLVSRLTRDENGVVSPSTLPSGD